MRASTIFAAVTLLSTASAARLPTHYVRRCANETHNDTTPDTGSGIDPAPPSSCDLSGLSQPAHTLSAPAAGLDLVMIALGKGTQNYTCTANLTAAPSAIGAMALLYDASCTMFASPQLSTQALSAAETSIQAASIGTHYFVDNTTPDFDIPGLGNTQLKKTEDCPAPAPKSDVKWLRLQATAASTSGVKEIYRLNTVGGLAPGSCEGRAVGDVVTVEYEAQYWIYATSATNTTKSADKSLPTPPEAAFTGASSRIAPFGVAAWTAVLSSTLYIFFL